jgi:hypothetical protein
MSLKPILAKLEKEKVFGKCLRSKNFDGKGRERAEPR